MGLSITTAPWADTTSLETMRGAGPPTSMFVSELGANAVRHAPRVEGGRIMLSVHEVPGAFRVEVRDPGHGFDPTPDNGREGGLGLLIVGHLAVDWGMLDGAGTTVWCELPVFP